MVISGNKKDLEEMREVNVADAHAFAQQQGMMDMLETSAKDNTNIDEAFLKMAKVCTHWLHELRFKTGPRNPLSHSFAALDNKLLMTSVWLIELSNAT